MKKKEDLKMNSNEMEEALAFLNQLEEKHRTKKRAKNEQEKQELDMVIANEPEGSTIRRLTEWLEETEELYNPLLEFYMEGELPYIHHLKVGEPFVSNERCYIASMTWEECQPVGNVPLGGDGLMGIVDISGGALVADPGRGDNIWSWLLFDNDNSWKMDCIAHNMIRFLYLPMGFVVPSKPFQLNWDKERKVAEMIRYMNDILYYHKSPVLDYKVPKQKKQRKISNLEEKNK